MIATTYKIPVRVNNQKKKDGRKRKVAPTGFEPAPLARLEP